MVTQHIERARRYEQEHGIKLKCLCEYDSPFFRYWIDENGVVYSFAREEPRIKQQEDNGNGYLRVQIRNTKYYVHRLVARYFLFNDDEKRKTLVHHIDGNRANNTVKNLMWVSPEEHRAIHAKNNKTPRTIKKPYNKA